MTIETSRFPAVLDCLGEAMEFVEALAEQHGLDTRRKMGLSVAVEEAFVNVCNYAYPEGSGDIELACGRDGEEFVVELADSGIPFDVLSLPPPDTSAGIDEREIGGLGVFMIRKFTDAVSYRRENGRNILRLVLHNRGTSEEMPS